MNTAEFLDISAAVVPDRVALITGDQTTSYAEMSAQVTKLANALQGLGLRKGDHLGVMSVNSSEYVLSYYACARLGVTFVPLNYRAKAEELEYMINTAEVKALFISDRYQDLVDQIAANTPSVADVVALETPREGQIHFSDLVAQGSDDFVYVEVDDDDPTIIIYTSGTTAMPKGVEITYQDLTVYVTNTMAPADPDGEHDKTLLSVPLFHIAGATAMISAIWGGRTLVILPQFTPESWMSAVDMHGVTHSMVVPTMLKRVMDHKDFSDFQGGTLKLIAYGAAPMPYEVVRKAIDVFSCGLMNAYGQTESTSAITFLGPDDHKLDGTPDEVALMERRLRSVGKVMDDVDLSIQAPDGAQLATGDEGEICVLSARTMKGYYKQEAATQEAIRGGWLHTGDVGFVDGEGYLFITGRTKDLIIRGGENIAPGEIEQVLEGYPGIEEAAVIGVADAEMGEAVKAVIVPAHGESVTLDDVRDFCKGRLASYKAPDYLTVTGQLPRNHMGKILKNDIRKLHGQPDNA
ncbi:MAG: Acyl-CoA synthetase (AMP-forming)/AMP-acid ligase II [Chloroflexi bacterium]|nr:MAG: Acyl-CoA synthetase (AMP-forming)/AMP-acid ligase II [Chloroflexota bacterium]